MPTVKPDDRHSIIIECLQKITSTMEIEQEAVDFLTGLDTLRELADTRFTELTILMPSHGASKNNECIEEYQTLSDIIKIIYQYFAMPTFDSHGLKKALTTYLADRWQRIKTTDYSYTHKLYSFISLFCASIASLINKEECNHLLMPTVKQEDYCANNLNELALSQFVTTEDGDSFIVLEDLFSTAFKLISEGESIVFNCENAEGKQRCLTKNEKAHIISSFPLARDYFALVDEFIKLLQSTTLGMLQILRAGLQKGDVKHGGEELEAGELAYLAIPRFFAWFNALSPQKQHAIEQLTHPSKKISDPPHPLHGQIISVKYILSKLREYDKKQERTATVYCLQILGSDLDDIIGHHCQKLSVPSVADKINALYKLQNIVDESLKKLRQQYCLAAFRRKDWAIIRLLILLKENIDCSLPVDADKPVLQFAIEHAPNAIVIQLIEAGVNIKGVTIDGLSLAEWAGERNRGILTALLNRTDITAEQRMEIGDRLFVLSASTYDVELLLFALAFYGATVYPNNLTHSTAKLMYGAVLNRYIKAEYHYEKDAIPEILPHLLDVCFRVEFLNDANAAAVLLHLLALPGRKIFSQNRLEAVVGTANTPFVKTWSEFFITDVQSKKTLLTLLTNIYQASLPAEDSAEILPPKWNLSSLRVLIEHCPSAIRTVTDTRAAWSLFQDLLLALAVRHGENFVSVDFLLQQGCVAQLSSLPAPCPLTCAIESGEEKIATSLWQTVCQTSYPTEAAQRILILCLSKGCDAYYDMALSIMEWLVEQNAFFEIDIFNAVICTRMPNFIPQVVDQVLTTYERKKTTIALFAALYSQSKQRRGFEFSNWNLASVKLVVSHCASAIQFFNQNNNFYSCEDSWFPFVNLLFVLAIRDTNEAFSVNFLLQQGCVPQLSSSWPESCPLTCAIESGQEEIAVFLWQKVKQEAQQLVRDNSTRQSAENIKAALRRILTACLSSPHERYCPIALEISEVLNNEYGFFIGPVFGIIISTAASNFISQVCKNFIAQGGNKVTVLTLLAKLYQNPSQSETDYSSVWNLESTKLLIQHCIAGYACIDDLRCPPGYSYFAHRSMTDRDDDISLVRNFLLAFELENDTNIVPLDFLLPKNYVANNSTMTVRQKMFSFYLSEYRTQDENNVVKMANVLEKNAEFFNAMIFKIILLTIPGNVKLICRHVFISDAQKEKALTVLAEYYHGTNRYSQPSANFEVFVEHCASAVMTINHSQESPPNWVEFCKLIFDSFVKKISKEISYFDIALDILALLLQRQPACDIATRVNQLWRQLYTAKDENFVDEQLGKFCTFIKNWQCKSNQAFYPDEWLNDVFFLFQSALENKQIGAAFFLSLRIIKKYRVDDIPAFKQFLTEYLKNYLGKLSTAKTKMTPTDFAVLRVLLHAGASRSPHHMGRVVNKSNSIRVDEAVALLFSLKKRLTVRYHSVEEIASISWRGEGTFYFFDSRGRTVPAFAALDKEVVAIIQEAQHSPQRVKAAELQRKILAKLTAKKKTMSLDEYARARKKTTVLCQFLTGGANFSNLANSTLIPASTPSMKTSFREGSRRNESNISIFTRDSFFNWSSGGDNWAIAKKYHIPMGTHENSKQVLFKHMSTLFGDPDQCKTNFLSRSPHCEKFTFFSDPTPMRKCSKPLLPTQLARSLDKAVVASIRKSDTKSPVMTQFNVLAPRYALSLTQKKELQYKAELCDAYLSTLVKDRPAVANSK